MDALFGLPRKKSSGKSCRDPLHGETMFVNQSDLDEFVGTVKSKKLKVSLILGDNMCKV